MATTLTPPLPTPSARRKTGRLAFKRNIGAIQLDPLRFSSAPLLPAALAFATGIYIVSLWWFPPAWLLIALLLQALLATIALVWHPRIALVPAVAVWLLLGAFAAEIQPYPAPQTELRRLAQHDLVTITGTILRAGSVRRTVSTRPFSSEQVAEQTQSVDIQIRSAAQPDEPQRPVVGGLRLSLYAPVDAVVPALGCGDTITVTATIRPPERYRDPGVWDSPAWMLSQGIGVIGSARTDRLGVLSHGSGFRFGCLQHALQTAAGERLIRLADAPQVHHLPAWLTISHDEAAMLSAMITGDRTWLHMDLRTPFERTGSFHLLVVSGLHLGLFAAFVFAIGRRLNIGRVPLTGITVILSLAYAVFTGFGQPVQRAFAMVVLYLAGRLIYRYRSPLNGLGFAALCLLAVNPHALFDAGLQMTLLTVVAVAGIAIPTLDRTSAPFMAATHSIDAVGMDSAFEPRLAQFRVTLRLLGEHLEPFVSRLPRHTKRVQKGLALLIHGSLLLFELCLVSAVIELVMTLPMAAYFHRVTTPGLLVNVLIVPALSLLLPAALVTMAALLAVPNLVWIPAMATGALLHAVLAIVQTAARWSMSEVRLPGPDLTTAALTLALCALAVWLVRLPGSLALPVGALTLLAAGMCAIAPQRPLLHRNVLEVTAIDVGQGDSILVVSPDGRTMLVDAGGPIGGSSGRATFDIGEQVVSSYLWHRRIRRLDVVALTHAHSDHMGGMPAILRNFRPRELWVGHNPPIPAYEALLQEAASLGIPVRSFSAGDTIPFGETSIDVLSPARDYQPRALAANNDSLVLHIRYAGHAALLEGDAEAGSEAAMLAMPPGDLASDLLKVGHHGSKTSTISPFLTRVAPRLAIVSVGPFNPYHHPRWDTLDKLETEGARTWRTDLLGLSSFYIDASGAYPAPSR